MDTFAHFKIFLVYSISFSFSSSGRFSYRSQPYCRFFSFFSLDRLWYLLQTFLWFFFSILIIFSWWVFRHFYIWKINYDSVIRRHKNAGSQFCHNWNNSENLKGIIEFYFFKKIISFFFTTYNDGKFKYRRR